MQSVDSARIGLLWLNIDILFFLRGLSLYASSLDVWCGYISIVHPKQDYMSWRWRAPSNPTIRYLFPSQLAKEGGEESDAAQSSAQQARDFAGRWKHRGLRWGSGRQSSKHAVVVSQFASRHWPPGVLLERLEPAFMVGGNFQEQWWEMEVVEPRQWSVRSQVFLCILYDNDKACYIHQRWPFTVSPL